MRHGRYDHILTRYLSEELDRAHKSTALKDPEYQIGVNEVPEARLGLRMWGFTNGYSGTLASLTYYDHTYIRRQSETFGVLQRQVAAGIKGGTATLFLDGRRKLLDDCRDAAAHAALVPCEQRRHTTPECTPGCTALSGFGDLIDIKPIVEQRLEEELSPVGSRFDGAFQVHLTSPHPTSPHGPFRTSVTTS